MGLMDTASAELDLSKFHEHVEAMHSLFIKVSDKKSASSQDKRKYLDLKNLVLRMFIAATNEDDAGRKDISTVSRLSSDGFNLVMNLIRNLSDKVDSHYVGLSCQLNDCISITKSIEVDATASARKQSCSESTLMDVCSGRNVILKNVGDLRNVLKKRRRVFKQGELSSKQDLPKKRIISLKKTSSIIGESLAVTVTFEKESKGLGFSDALSANKKDLKDKDAMNFRIKTLDEIRKEKEKETDNPESVSSPEYATETFEQTYNWEGDQCDLVDESKDYPLSNGVRTSVPKRKLKRKPIEVYKAPQKVSKFGSLAVVGVNFSQTLDLEAAEKTKNETTGPKAFAIPVMAVEPSETCRIKITLKRSSPVETAVPTKLKKTSPGSIMKHNSFETEPVTEMNMIEEFSEGTKSAVVKLHEIKKSSPPSKRPLLLRRNLSPAMINSSDTDCVESVRYVCEIPEKWSNDVSSALKPEIISSESNGSSPKDLSIDTNRSSPQLTPNKDAFVDNSDADLFTLSSPVSAMNQERSLTLSSVDDIDKLFSGCDTDLTSEEVDCTIYKNSDDIFLELEQMIQS